MGLSLNLERTTWQGEWRRGDVHVNFGALRITRPTSVAFEIAIDDISIGEVAKLAEVFSVEGTTELSESGFSSFQS